MTKHGVICPLRCGQCCDYWQDVPELLADAATRPNAVSCPHEGRRGCQLRREDRPGACLEYLCGVATAVVVGSIDREEGIRLKEHCRIEVPYKLPRPKKVAMR
jgi:hypothetical protein